MQTPRKPSNRNKTNLIVDMAIFSAFLVAMAPRFSGLAIHEWLGISFGAAIITHLLLHWQWIVEITKRFFGKVQPSARINYILNALLFIDVTVIIFTGLMISQSALPALGITVASSGAWRGIHGTAADLSLLLTGLHVALHWQWIVNMTKRFILAPLSARSAPQLSVGASPELKLNPQPVRKEI